MHGFYSDVWFTRWGASAIRLACQVTVLIGAASSIAGTIFVTGFTSGLGSGPHRFRCCRSGNASGFGSGSTFIFSKCLWVSGFTDFSPFRLDNIVSAVTKSHPRACVFNRCARLWASQCPRRASSSRPLPRGHWSPDPVPVPPASPLRTLFLRCAQLGALRGRHFQPISGSCAWAQFLPSSTALRWCAASWLRAVRLPRPACVPETGWPFSPVWTLRRPSCRMWGCGLGKNCCSLCALIASAL